MDFTLRCLGEGRAQMKREVGGEGDFANRSMDRK
jgi:hypothetical protein